MHVYFSRLVRQTKIIVLAAVVLLPTFAQAEFLLFPAIFEVFDVAQNDILNIRREPDANAEDIGFLRRSTCGDGMSDATYGWALEEDY
ncbi:MAG: hypothetical protein V3V13_02695 [Paracoccaceae bacterium]